MPVLLREVVRTLDPQPGETVVDCTAGLGGHAAVFAQRVGASGRVVLGDADGGNLARAEAFVRSLPSAPEVIAIQGNFAELPRKLGEHRVSAQVVFADLGFSSTQMDDPGRGFSIRADGPLDMRLDRISPTTAARLVATLTEQELGEIIRDYGEERHWRRVARKLVDERQRGPIETTGRLAEIVASVVGSSGRIHPATRVFQALRIAVNDELGSLRSLLESVTRAASGLMGASGGGAWLARGGRGTRIGIVSFHSLEDRLVKNAFGELVKRGLAETLTKPPIEPGEEEQRDNPRSRSAKFRAIRLTV